MKNINKLLTLVSLFSLCACGPDVPPGPGPDDPPDNPPVEKTKQEIYKLKTEKSLVADTNFRNGFYLLSPESTNQYVECNIDYGGEAETDYYDPESERTQYWSMCQWWTPFNFKNATFSKHGDVYKYENESRLFEVNPKTSEFRMRLDADAEYEELYHGPKDPSKSWSHFLIQQSMPKDLHISPAEIDSSEEGLHMKLDFTLNEITYKGEGTPLGDDCAQFMFYLQLYNDVPSDANFDEVGKRNTKLWFGMPLLDTRYDFVQQYRAYDRGFEGATGHLIANMPSNLYMGNQKPKINQKYSIDFDVLEELQDAFIYGVQIGALKNCLWQNMKIGYMNFGWEIPGEYVVDSTVTNLDVYVG